MNYSKRGFFNLSVGSKHFIRAQPELESSRRRRTTKLPSVVGTSKFVTNADGCGNSKWSTHRLIQLQYQRLFTFVLCPGNWCRFSSAYRKPMPRPVGLLAKLITNWRAGCGRPACPVRREGRVLSPFLPLSSSDPSPASSVSELRDLSDKFRGSNAGRRPNPIPAWANGPGSWGIFQGRAEGPVHSEVGRTFRPPPGGRRCPGALPQAVIGPRRWRSDRPGQRQ